MTTHSFVQRLVPTLTALAVAWLAGGAGRAEALHQPQPVKVFISVDMEGLAGVAVAADVNANGRDYEHFRKIMAAETNAAVEGAIRAGATEVIVRDSHGGKLNLLPEDLHPAARLIRGATAGPKNMMEGIDATFAAAVFIGYHAKAGTPDAVLAHTSTGNVVDFSINGVSLPEAGYNALVAGLYNVPVVFVAGDQAFVDQARGMLGAVEAVATKVAMGETAISGLSPEEVQRQIRAGVANGIMGRARMKPYTMTGPYRMVLKVKADKPLYPGATRVREGESAFEHADLLEVLNAFNAMK